jgi:hypothetical protein
MSKHYNRINVLGCTFVAVCAVISLIYAGASFKDHKAIYKAMAHKREMEKQHFSGWRLGMGPLNQADIDRGLFFDEYEQKMCTTRGYPRFDPCPAQQYYVDGIPSQPPIETPPETPRKSPVKK